MSETESQRSSDFSISGPTLNSGWGRAPKSLGKTLQIKGAGTREKEVELLEFITTNGSSNKIAPRGLGRSYGDSSTLSSGLLTDPGGWKDTFDFDPSNGTLRVSSGYSLDDIMRKLVPCGYFVPVTPGTRYVSIGGAVAADIHGKNHHVDGSFGTHTKELRLVSPTGVHVLYPSDPEFKATVGGMGLTGFVSEAVIDLIPISTSKVKVTTRVTQSIDDTILELEENDTKYRYSVAWIDCMAKGKSLGRSVITWGEHLELSELTGAGDPLSFDPRFVASVPDIAPSWLLNRLSVRAFNELWYRKGKLAKEVSIESIESFFHPLDMVGSWNRLYGQKGFLQYQFVVPFGAEDTLKEAVRLLSNVKVPSFLAVLKRFGKGSGNYIAFPSPGWTLALDIPTHRFGLADLLDRLDALIVASGGRVYLAKDSRVSKHLIPMMYPEIDSFREVANRLDPECIFTTDMSKRLALRDEDL